MVINNLLYRLQITEKTENTITIKSEGEAGKAVFVGAPFRLDLYTGNQLTVSVNARGLLRFEHHRPKPEQ